MSLSSRSQTAVHSDMQYGIYLKEGKGFLKAAAGKTKKFNESIRYNLLAMAIEKFLMAALDRNNAMPDNHTFSDLVEAADKYCPLPQILREELLSFEKHQMICSFADYFRTDTLDDQVIGDMLHAVRRLEAWTEDICRRGSTT